ncbi:hypothetical protein S245_058973, partial [Arachis hypogaea]
FLLPTFNSFFIFYLKLHHAVTLQGVPRRRQSLGICSKSPRGGDRVVATTDGTKENHKNYKTTVPSDLVHASHTKEDINKQKRGAENAAGTSVV